MLIHYTVVVETVTPEHMERGMSGDLSILENDAADLKYILRRARSLGITRRDGRQFVSVTHDEDRGYFERGEERFYYLGFPRFGERNLSRIGRLLDRTLGR